MAKSPEYPFGENVPEMDIEAFLNMRNWLEDAVTAKGARVTDAGIGMGAADLGIELDGWGYSLSIRPRPKPVDR